MCGIAGGFEFGALLRGRSGVLFLGLAAVLAVIGERSLIYPSQVTTTSSLPIVLAHSFESRLEVRHWSLVVTVTLYEATTGAIGAKVTR
jgi:hypothetical protein